MSSPDSALAGGHRPGGPAAAAILLRDVRDAGPHRVAGTLAHALRDPIEDKVPAAWATAATRLLPFGELAVVPGPHNANYGAAGHLAERVLAFLQQRVVAPDGQAG